jgi:hypothetical protein
VERSASTNGWKVENWWNGKELISRENQLNENLWNKSVKRELFLKE